MGMTNKFILLLAGFVLLGACEKKQSHRNSMPPAPVSVKVPTIAQITIAEGNAANSNAALETLSLIKSDDVTYDNLDLNGANARFQNVRINTDKADTVTLENLNFSGLDAENEVARFGRVSLKNLEINAPKDNHALKIGSFDVINPSPALENLVSELTKHGQPQNKIPHMSKLNFDRLRATRLEFDDGSENASAQISVTAMGIDGNNADSIDQIIFGGVSIKGEDDGHPISIGFRRVQVNGLKKNIIKGIPTSFEDIEDAFGQDTTTPIAHLALEEFEMKFKGMTVSLPLWRMDNHFNANGDLISSQVFPVSLQLKPEGRLKTAKQLRKILSAIGTDSLDIQFGTKRVMSENQERITVDAKDNYIGIGRVANIRIGFEMSGVRSYEAMRKKIGSRDLSKNPQLAVQLFGGMKLHSFQIDIENTGGLPAIIDHILATSKQKISRAQLSAQLQSMSDLISTQAQNAGFDQSIVKETIKALASFLKNPKTLTIQMKPRSPLNLGSLMNPAYARNISKSSLGLKISNK